jgi:hypothetical protein
MFVIEMMLKNKIKMNEEWRMKENKKYQDN